MFTNCWAIIDHLLACQRILISLNITILNDELSKFSEKFQNVIYMRNKFQHINQNINNIASSKGNIDPLFGSVSYFYIPEENWKIESDGSVNVTKGQIIGLGSVCEFGDGTIMPFTNPVGKQLWGPVSCVQFSAFDKIIDFDEAVRSLSKIASETERIISESIRIQVEKLHFKEGIPKEELLKTRPRVGAIVMEGHFANDLNVAPLAVKSGV